MAGSVWKLAKAAHLSLFGEAYEGFSFFLGLFLSALLILVIRAGFLWIGKYNSPKVQRLITLGLFLAMSLCFCVLLSTFHANLRNDCYQDVDTAAWLVDHTSVPVDNKHPGELLPFGNNYFFILATSSVIRVLYSMGISDVVPCLQAINAEAMLLGVLFTWLLVRDSFDIKAANRVLLLCALNPLFYGFTFWYYSNSISIPIMMAIPWVALKGYRALRQPIPRTVRMLFWGAVMGLLVFLGYEIRPTAIFPFIALCVIALFPVGGAGWDALREFISDRRKAKAKGVPEESTPSESKKATPTLPAPAKDLLVAAAAFALVLAVSFSTFFSVRDAYFGELIPYNRPITYWLAMGAHGNGNKSSKDDAIFVKSLSHEDNKSLLCLQRAIDHYRENGVVGTVDLWARKTAHTWSDGFGQISRKIVAGQSETPVFAFLAGPNAGLYELYCQSYRLVCVLGALLFCLGTLSRHRIQWIEWKSSHPEADPHDAPTPGIRAIHQTMLITLLGGIVFYMLWEARGVYSAPFVPALLIVAECGLAQETGRRKWLYRDGQRDTSALVLCGLVALLVGTMFYEAAGISVSANHYRIYTKGKLRHYHIIAKEGIRPETANLLINDPAGNFDPDEPDVGLLESREKDLSFLSTLKGPEQIEQDFAVRKSFNRITLPAFTQGTKKTVSPYWITVKDDNGKTFLSRVIHRSNIRGNSLTLDFPPIEGGHYHFCIKKISPVMEDILFFSKYDSYRIGAYEGTLAIDGKDGFANDLGLTVLYFSPEEPYLPSGTRLALALALVLAAGFALAALYRAERSTP